MWMSKAIASAGSTSLPTSAKVTACPDGQVTAVGAYGYRGIPFCAPYGFSYLPCEGDNILVIGTQGGDICAGVVNENTDLKQGEVRISSSGGGYIHLQINGDVNINGVVITRQGKIIGGQ